MADKPVEGQVNDEIEIDNYLNEMITPIALESTDELHVNIYQFPPLLFPVNVIF